MSCNILLNILPLAGLSLLTVICKEKIVFVQALASVLCIKVLEDIEENKM